MAGKSYLTDEQVEKEIEVLKNDPDVALARRQMRLKYKRRQTLYQLRDLKKQGAALREAGIDYDALDVIYGTMGDEDSEPIFIKGVRL